MPVYEGRAHGMIGRNLSRRNSKPWTSTLSKPLAVLAVSLLLSACPSVHHEQVVRDGWQTDPSVFAERFDWHKGVKAWKLTAKIGISTPEIKESANLVWQVNGDSNVMRLFGPLGVGSIRIEFDQSGVTLVDSKGRTHKGQSAESLLTRITGWPIPVDALRYWLFVVPAPDSAFQYAVADESLADSPVVSIDQRGWQIDYSKFQAASTYKPELPRKIVAIKTALLGDVEQTAKVRLIVKSWSPL